MKLYFVRHGRTEWNEEGRIQGANGDSPLLESSVQQLKALGQHLSQTYFDAAYSSDFLEPSILLKSFSSKINILSPSKRLLLYGNGGLVG